MELLKVHLEVMKFSFSLGETRDDHKQVESGEAENSTEQLEASLKALTADHQGRFTEIWNLWINDAENVLLKLTYNSWVENKGGLEMWS